MGPIGPAAVGPRTRGRKWANFQTLEIGFFTHARARTARTTQFHAACFPYLRASMGSQVFMRHKTEESQGWAGGGPKLGPPLT